MKEKLTQEKYDVLDKGFIRIIDIMGDDSSIVQAARVSYGSGTKTVNEDRGLIRYLMRHKHTTPFEMCEIKLHLKMPMFVARQWIRHRTANVNEYSARYSMMEEEFYIPRIEDIANQSENNKQARGKAIDSNTAEKIIQAIEKNSKDSYLIYQDMIDKGVAREIARIVLPVNMYTQFYWKIDLHNLLHFVQLRSHATAQYEIRVYSEIIEKVIENWVPYTYEAFKDYKKEAVTISKNTKHCLKRSGIEPENLGKTELLEFEAEWS